MGESMANSELVMRRVNLRSTSLKAFIVRRWYDFRNGHSMYLAFTLSFTNFILIFYRLLIERIAILHSLLPELWLFALIFIVTYPTAACIIGWIHRYKIVPIESVVRGEVGSFSARIWRTLIDYLLDPTKEENIAQLKRLREYLESIEKRSG